MFIIHNNCVSCGLCEPACPVGCISSGDSQYNVGDGCIDCGACASVCPVGAPEME